jgi:hypothetical protein
MVRTVSADSKEPTASNRLNTEFVERGTTKGLDTACVKNIRRRGFALR